MTLSKETKKIATISAVMASIVFLLGQGASSNFHFITMLPNPNRSVSGKIFWRDLQSTPNVGAISAPAAFTGNPEWHLPPAELPGCIVSDGSGNTRLDICLLTVANAGTTGTTVSTLTKLTGAPSTAVMAGTSDTGGVVGITVAGAGTTGSAQIQWGGPVNCVFDGATVSGDYVQISGSTAANCHDVGSSYPPVSSGQVIGRVLTTNGSAGTYKIILFPPEIRPPGSGTSGNVFPWWPTLVPPPALASWTQVDTGSQAVFTDIIGGVNIWARLSGGAQRLKTIETAAPGAPFTVTALILADHETFTFPHVGLFARDTGTKYLVFGTLSDSNRPYTFVGAWNSVTSQTTDRLGPTNISFHFPTFMWLRIQYNGTNLIFSHSDDSQIWTAHLSESATAFLATAPSKIGMFINMYNSSQAVSGSLVHWVVTTP